MLVSSQTKVKVTEKKSKELKLGFSDIYLKQNIYKLEEN